MTDHTISLANERVGDLTANNKHYLAVHKYADQEYDSGKEWTDALTKSIMAYIYEAVSKMRGNTTSTTAGYIVMLVVLALQYVLLGKRIDSLMAAHAGMSTLINRMTNEAASLRHEVAVLPAHKDEVAYFSSDDESLDSAGSDGHRSHKEHSDERSQSPSGSDLEDLSEDGSLN